VVLIFVTDFVGKSSNRTTATTVAVGAVGSLSWLFLLAFVIYFLPYIQKNVNVGSAVFLAFGFSLFFSR
jgi:hypothetical protein